MKFVCEKGTLLKEVAIAQEIIGSKSTVNVLSNVFLEASNNTLIIKSTDITIYFETKVPVSVSTEGKTTVKGNIFLSILNSIPDGELEFEKIDTKIIIKPLSSKKTKFQLKTNSSDQYPELPSSENSNPFEMPINDFKKMITQTIFAISDDETRYLMNGVSFEKTGEKFIMVSTDGRRMAYIEKPAEKGINDFKSIIIPEKILGIVQKHSGDEGNVSIGITEKNIFITFGSYSFSSSLIEGKFPDYRRVIPTDHSSLFTVKRKDMLEALKRVSLLVEQKNKRIYVKLSNGEASVYSEDTEIGEASEVIPAEYNGEDIQIALNYHYIDEPFKAIEDDDVSVHFKDPTKAITIKPVPEKDFLHVVMPMQSDS
jgi:DNA polymerase-3 subunit beta